MVSFIIYNFLSIFFIIFIILGLATSQRSFARSLQKKRKKSFGDERLPTTWDQLETVSEKFLKTHSEEDFLVFNHVINKEGAHVMGFMSPFLLDVLKKTEEWSVEGTFVITKWTLFSQVSFSFYILFKFSTLKFQYFFN